MLHFLKKYTFELLLFFFIALYAVYFSYFTILRHETINSYYYDLGIMDQTVYNTYKGRILELTSLTNMSNIKRMSIHNDMFLALLAPFYVIYTGPEMLLVIQSVVIALGAIPLYLLAKQILKSKLAGLIFAIAYLLYTPLEHATIFDFHAVTLATPLLLYMFYFFYTRKYVVSFLFFLLVLVTKEQVGLTTGLFGMVAIIKSWNKKIHETFYGFLVLLFSFGWFIASIWYIIPHFRDGTGSHFALSRYGDFGDTPGTIFKGLFTKPQKYLAYVIHIDTLRYFFFLFAPLAFLSFLAPIFILIVGPEFAINLLSNDWNMRNIIYHYTSVINPFIFIAAVFGVKRLLFMQRNIQLKWVLAVILIMSIIMNYMKGPLPFAREGERDVTPFVAPLKEASDVRQWQHLLKDDSLIISATGKLAPHFTDRKTFYLFSSRNYAADYILLLKQEVQDPTNAKLYNDLKTDSHFQLIFRHNDLEIYKKIK